MTSVPVSNALEYHCEPVSQSTFTFERLEFGKYCVSPDGPVESNRDNIPIGYSQLGWSNGFPSELISICHPTSIGIVKDEGEKLPFENVPGTVLRPVARGRSKKIWNVFYRVRARSEGGEGQCGRLYTLARYLCAAEADANPLTMLGAMDADALRGMTRSEAQDISAVQIDAAEVELDLVAEAFLDQALTYVLSGIPLSMNEAILEKEFFTLVAAVHAKLPRALQPHLSAGWNVGSSFSGRLGITHTTSRMPSAALFSPRTLTWTPPEYVTTWNARREPVANQFFEARLGPGRLFNEYVLAANPTATGNSSSVYPKPSDLVGEVPLANLPELPFWDDASTVRILRYPGLQAKDQFAIAALDRWLRNNEEDPGLYRDIRRLSYRANRLSALNLILESLADPGQRPRAQQALWLSVSGNVPGSFTNQLNGATGVGAHRARLIAALGRGDVAESLEAFVHATANHEAEGLPHEVIARLNEVLDKSITPPNRNTPPYHLKLLSVCPSPYREWVKQNPLALMWALNFSEETPPGAFEFVEMIADSDAARAFHRLRRGEIPPLALPALLGSLGSNDRAYFNSLFTQQWARTDDQTAQRRQSLLEWFHVGQFISRHPLLRLESAEALTDSEVDRVVADVEGRCVPPSLFGKVAVLALKQWPNIVRRITSRVGWDSIIRLWPSDYARVLAGGGGTEFPASELVKAGNELTVPADQLRALISERFRVGTLGGTAPLLWDLALRLEPRHHASAITLIDLCADVSRGVLPDGEMDNDDDSTIFERLAHESGKLALAPGNIQAMWAQAHRPWQIGLLLPLFPQEDLRPSARQLSELVRYQDWLVDHVSKPFIHSNRRNWFNVATKDFHSLSFHHDHGRWNEDFVAHRIWAAFRGVPASCLPQGALRRALRAYSRSDDKTRTGKQPHHVIEGQARMCCQFLEAYERAASEELAFRMVLYQFVLPLLAYRGNEEFVKGEFGRLGAEYRLPRYTLPERVYYRSPSPALHELLSRFVMAVPRKSLMKAIHDFFKKLEARKR